jgi:hypothetical protein
MDTPMQDVIDSLPLADDMRAALVHRQGPLGELLDAVAAREQGDTGVGATVPHADELYLRSVIWANTAAESLFGAAPSASSAPSAPGRESAPRSATPSVAESEGGPVRRFFAAIGRLFGRRS